MELFNKGEIPEHISASDRYSLFGRSTEQCGMSKIPNDVILKGKVTESFLKKLILDLNNQFFK